MGTAIRYKPLDLDYNIPIRKDLFRIAPELMVDFFLLNVQLDPGGLHLNIDTAGKGHH